MTGLKSKIWIFLIGFFFGIISLVFVIGFVLLNPKMKELVKKAYTEFKNNVPASQIKSMALNTKSLLELHTLVPSKFLNFPFPGTRAEESDDVVTWIAPLSMRVQPLDSPPSSSIGTKGSSKPIHLIGLKGETVSFQVILRSKNSNVPVSLSVIPSSDPSLASCVTIHRYLEFFEHFKASAIKYGPINTLDVPDPLIPFHDPYTPGRKIVENLSLSKKSNIPIWIDVHFSKNCSGKHYYETLVVKTKDKIIRSTSIDMEVLNVTMPEHVGLDRWMEVFVSRFWRNGMVNSPEEFRQMYWKAFTLAHQYGFSTNDADSLPKIQWNWKTGDPISVDWSDYDSLFGPMISGQLTGSTPNVWCLPIQTYQLGVGWWGGFTILGDKQSPISAWKGIPDHAAQQLAKLIVQHWQEKGWPINRGFAYIFDEPMHKLYYYADTYKLIAKEAESLHKGSNNKIRVMITDAPYIWRRKQAGHDKKVMVGKIDIWAAGAEVYIPGRMQERQKDGNRVWFYQAGGPPFIGQNDLYSFGPGFRMWFWTAWKYRVNGVFYWADTFWNDNRKGSNPYESPGIGDGMIFYPGKQLHYIGYPDIEGPIPSVRMAQWRRGYQDYKYLYLLKQKGQGAEADQRVDELVKKALDDGGYFPYWRNPLWQKPGDWSHDPQAWHKSRIEMARRISELYKANN